MHKTEYVKRLRYNLANIYRLMTIPWCQYNIPITKISNLFGCSFGPKGWHPIISTLQEYDKNQKITYNKTTLYQYHKNFTPKETNYFIPSVLNTKLNLFIYPWGTFNGGLLHSTKVVQNSRFCGPSSDQFISDEFDRIILLYNELKKHGYKPRKYPNSYIGGTFLKRENGDYRFIVMQGNHRLSILSHLNYSQITVRLIPESLKFIKESNITNWVAVKSGNCKIDDARKVFNFFFEENGSHIKNFFF